MATTTTKPANPTLSVDGGEPTTLDDFLDANNGHHRPPEGDDPVTLEDVDALLTLEPGEHIYIGFCKVERVA